MKDGSGEYGGPADAESRADADLDLAVFVALGSNDKGVRDGVHQALEAALAGFPSEGLEVMARSSWWRSAAWPNADDPAFLNGVVRISTVLDPHALMAALGRIEAAFGRTRGPRNAPRTLDLDLVAYGRRAGDLDGLILPHPRAAERLFVMGPLAEIAPDWRHPVSGLTAAALARTAAVGRDARPVEPSPHS
jgi:2-amino-4-hydroxy-6-hydroxymethyldihydropteridine diphosphokinase